MCWPVRCSAWRVATAYLLLAAPAAAEDCSKSRDYLLQGLAGELAAPAASYQTLFKVCLETLRLANVKDAYVLRDGGIAIVAKRNALFATAETLAQFCDRFPTKTARFVTPRELKRRLTVGTVVTMSSTGSPSCRKIKGMT